MTMVMMSRRFTGITWTVLTDCMMSVFWLVWARVAETSEPEIVLIQRGSIMFWGAVWILFNIRFTATRLARSHVGSSSSRRPPSSRQQQFIWCFSVWRLKSPTTNHNILDSNLAADLAAFTSCLLSWSSTLQPEPEQTTTHPLSDHLFGIFTVSADRFSIIWVGSDIRRSNMLMMIPGVICTQVIDQVKDQCWRPDGSQLTITNDTWSL